MGSANLFLREMLENSLWEKEGCELNKQHFKVNPDDLKHLENKIDALGEALLALDKLEAINLWINRDRFAKEKYATINCIIEGIILPTTVKEHLNEVEKQ